MDDELDDGDPFDGMDPFEWWHHHRKPKLRSVDMAVTLNPGQAVTLTATAKLSDGSVDTAATIAFSEDSGGAVVSLTEPTTSAGVATAVFTFVADGTANVTATATDGSLVESQGVNNPDQITCVTPAPAATLASVDIEEGTPA